MADEPGGLATQADLEAADHKDAVDIYKRAMRLLSKKSMDVLKDILDGKGEDVRASDRLKAAFYVLDVAFGKHSASEEKARVQPLAETIIIAIERAQRDELRARNRLPIVEAEARPIAIPEGGDLHPGPGSGGDWDGDPTLPGR